MVENLKLVEPSIEYRESFLTAMDEFADAGIEDGFWTKEDDRETLEPYLKKHEDWSKGLNVPETFVPNSMFWILDENEIIGRVHIRHTLNDKLLKRGGHIGYYIKPSKWNQGYGTKACELALKKMPEFKVSEVLITADDENQPSWRIIEKHGGVLENKVEDDKGNLVRRYWIDL